jgi:phospho-N-acetylmuramoyl-pentapeptide-transferase
MLYHLLFPLHTSFSAFNVFRYLTVRSFIAFIIAAIISILWGKRFILLMKRKQFGQVVRDDGPREHFKKAGTPTFGGVFIIGSICATVLICGNFSSLPLLAALVIMLGYFLLGLRDDYLKILKKNHKGVSAKMKLFWQILIAGLVSFLLVHFNIIDTALYVPFLKGKVFDMGSFYILFATLVIVGSSNAVNLTDGLDGLATGPILTSAGTLAVLSYLCGHFELSSYLYIPYVPKSGELCILASATVGAGVGFLWYNSYPAQIFMGDVGSLPLGGALGAIAVLTKNELLFMLIGGIFVLEALSVLIQVGSYKMRKKRIFRMAPIHHHFELKGWPEPKVIVRFWIISIILAILSLATIKLR